MAKEIDQRAEGNNILQAGGNIDASLTINTQYLQTNCPSHLIQIMLKLNEHVDSIEDMADNTITYEIQKKIDHNQLVKYKHLVNQYAVYGSIVDSSFDALDNEKPSSKKRIYKYIHLQYKSGKAELATKLNNGVIDLAFIKSNSDNLMDYVSMQLKKVYLSSQNSSITIEDAEFNINIIVCKAFIDCKILENPN